MIRFSKQALFVLGVIAASFPSLITAQCALQWSAGNGAGMLATMRNGDAIGFPPGGGIARYDGATWHPLGSGVSGGGVAAVAESQNGDIVVAGSFTMAGSVAASGVARWDGTAWHGILTAPSTGMSIRGVAALPNGDIAVAGPVSTGPTNTTIYVELWDGSLWQVIGTSFGYSGFAPFPTLRGFGMLPSGDLVALGCWQRMDPAVTAQTYNELVRWDGSGWHYLGAIADPNSLLVSRNGTVYVGSRFRIQAWDGASGQFIPIPHAGADVQGMCELPNGDIAAGGSFYSLIPVGIGLQRWDGTVWSSMGFGTNATRVNRLVVGGGELFVSGYFSAAGGVPTPSGQAILTTPCPATATSLATACVGPAGPLLLTAETRPWVGATFRSKTTGFATNSLALSLVGLNSTQTALASLHPSGLPNCDLLTTSEASLLVVPVAGVSDFAFAIPSDPAFVGVTLFHQFLQGELNGQGTFLSLSSSNRLTLTVGVF